MMRKRMPSTSVLALFLDEPDEQAKVAQCTVRTLAEHLLGRSLSALEITGWIPEFVQRFEESDHNFKCVGASYY